MGEWVRTYQTKKQCHDIRFSDLYVEPWLSLTLQGDEVKYNKTKDEWREYLTSIPLTFNILSDGYISFMIKIPQSGTVKTIKYSRDEGETWTEIISSSAGTRITVTAGETLQFIGDNASYAFNGFNGTSRYNVLGNAMSLIDSENFRTLKDFTEPQAFLYLFRDSSTVINAEDLILPATGLTKECYNSMFYYCTSLETEPELRATVLAEGCYAGMFSRCPKLTEPVELPAAALAPSCYRDMYYNCTNLTRLPELKAPALESSCYMSMFAGCVKLSAVTNDDLPATMLANGCYRSMFGGCTGLTAIPTTFIYSTIPSQAFLGMFAGCTNVTTPPTTISGDTFGFSSCEEMFNGCTDLTTIPTITGRIAGDNAFKACFRNCKTLTDLSSFSLPSVSSSNGGVYSSTFEGCSSLTKAPYIEVTVNQMPTSIFNSTFKNCPLLTDVFNLPARVVANYCYQSMFQNCTSLETPPVIGATSMIEGGTPFAYMFAGCTSLRYIPELNIRDIVADAAFKYMFSGCTTISSVTNNTIYLLQAPESCYGMFAGCTSLTEVNGFEFLCNTLNGCRSMFEECVNLVKAPHLTPLWLDPGCYERMFYNCAKLSAITADFLEEPTDEFTKDWVVGVMNSGDFYKHPESTWSKYGTNAIPEGWTEHTVYGIRADKDYIVTKGTGDTFNLTVTSNDSWTIQNVPSWLTLSQTAGTSGDTTIVGTVAANTGDFREVTLGLSVNNDTTVVDCELLQEDTVDYRQLPVTIEALSAGTLYWINKNGTGSGKTITYSINGGAYGRATSTVEGVPFVCQAGDKIAFFGNDVFNGNGFSGDSSLVCCVYGNTKSLNNGTGWTTGDTINDNQSVFYRMFSDFPSLVTYKSKKLHIYFSTSNLNWGKNSYLNSCFKSCPNIVNGKNFVLEGDRVGYLAMSEMFRACTGLRCLPVMSALVYSDYGMNAMFAYCYSLRNVDEMTIDLKPERQGYNGTFSHCFGLRYARIQFNASGLTDQECGHMFTHCVNLLEGPAELPPAVTGQSCTNMFFCCKALRRGPKLPAKTINIDRSYCFMFKDCNKLNYVWCDATSGNNPNRCTFMWLTNVSKTGDFYKNPDTTWGRNDGGIPSSWTVHDIE